MQIAPEEIRQMVRAVWDAILQLPIENETHPPSGKPQTLAATVHIAGAWQGAVSITCTPELAKMAASRMLQLEKEQLSKQDVHDVLGELTNMVGGNFKAILPEVGWLSLPTVVEGSDFAIDIPHTRELARLPLKCGEHTFCVTLNERVAA